MTSTMYDYARFCDECVSEICPEYYCCTCNNCDECCVCDRKSFIHSYTNDEIPMEFIVKFDMVLDELEETFEELDSETYTDAEIFAEKFSDF